MENIQDLEQTKKEYLDRLSSAETAEETNLILGFIDYIDEKINLILK